LLESPDEFGEVRLLSVPDVSAMKLNAIANRGSKKDFFDLCRLLEQHPLGEMLDFFERKYANTDRFIVLRSLSWFEDADVEPDPISFEGLSWEQVKQIVLAALRGVK
jgi:predicted nucleotidyltransferase component of viral defense system